jgi:hypothetical protein
MEDSTAIGLAMVGCAYFSFFIGLSLIAIIAFTINLIIELIKEAINKRKQVNNDRQTDNNKRR